MTEVYRRDFYEWPMNNDEAICYDCEKEMDVPDLDDINRDMKEPFWLRFNNFFRAFCESCWSDRIFKEGEASKDE